MATRPYKALFVTHDAGFYGASRSLQTFLKSYETAQAGLMVNRRLLGTNDLDAIRARFGARIADVREAWLPFDRCFKGKPPYSLRLRARNALALWGRSALWRSLHAERFDFIYLNSVVLHPLVHEDLPFILHVREIYDGSNPGVFDSVRRARGLLFIDEATFAPFREAGITGTVLNNPIDMTDVDPGAAEKLRASWNATGKTVFTLVGVLNDNKGAEFVIECFKRAQNPDAVLVLVGEGDKHYLERCKRAAEGRSDIVFHGFDADVPAIYAASDYVLRGEAYPCVGRTIYEGLYAGCGVLIPGASEDGARMFESNRFKDRIHFYPPRSITGLTTLLRQLHRHGGERVATSSNVADFVRGFDRFLGQVLATERASSEPRCAAGVLDD